MKNKIVLALVLTNLITLSGFLFYWRGYNTMVELAKFTSTLNQEYLLITPIVGRDGYKQFFATPTIFRTLEECNKTETDWNAGKMFPGAIWHCEKIK